MAIYILVAEDGKKVVFTLNFAGTNVQYFADWPKSTKIFCPLNIICNALL